CSRRDLVPRNKNSSFDRKDEAQVRAFMRSLANELAVHYPLSKQLEVARLTDAINLNGNDASLYYQRGCVFEDLLNGPSACADFTKALELDNTMADAYFKRGCVRAGMEEHTAAIQDLTRALQLNGGLVESYTWRGYAHREAGDLKAAIKDYNK